MAKEYRRYYKVLGANSSETDEFIPPSGTYYISALGGSSSASPDTLVEIIWDFGGTEEILFATHNDSNQNVNIELPGDGAKILAIRLTNDQGVPDTLGGFWTGSD